MNHISLDDIEQLWVHVAVRKLCRNTFIDIFDGGDFVGVLQNEKDMRMWKTAFLKLNDVNESPDFPEDILCV